MGVRGGRAFYFVWIDDAHIVIFTQGSRSSELRHGSVSSFAQKARGWSIF